MPPTRGHTDGRVQIVARVPKKLRRSLDDVAEQRGVSLTALITELLTAGLEKD